MDQRVVRCLLWAADCAASRCTLSSSASTYFNAKSSKLDMVDQAWRHPPPMALSNVMEVALLRQ